MKYVIYTKLLLYNNTILDNMFMWVVDYLTNRHYIISNYFYTVIYMPKIILKNNDYILSYNYKKNLVKPHSLNLFLQNFKYTKQILKLHGVGYKLYTTQEKTLVLIIGYSHKIYVKFPKNISYTISNNNTCIELYSYNSILLTTIIAKLKQLHNYDPYKGKGFRHAGEIFNPKFYKK